MSFGDIKGQAQAIAFLQEYLRQDRLSPGYLFVGPEGIGKKLVALNLAKAVNCQSHSYDACEKCPSCVKINNNQHPDVHLIDNFDKEIKIEEIRNLEKDIGLKSYEAKIRVFIINNAHRFNSESANALLKTLEEPPPGSLIILISDKPWLLFKTIISRCKVLRFSALRRTELENILKHEHGLERNLAHFLAYFSEGRFGYALRLKDTDILQQKNMFLDTVASSASLNLEGLNPKSKEDVRTILNILTSYFRDIYLVKTGLAHSEIINLDRKDELLREMSRFSFTHLNRIFLGISEAMMYLEQNINVRLLVSNLDAQICKA